MSRRHDDFALELHEAEMQLLEAEAQEEEASEQELIHQRAVLAALLLAGAEADREARLARRHRAYLTRPELMHAPRISSPWQSLYHSREDRAYITTMGLDVITFDLLLDAGFREQWETTPIPRTDTSATGQPRLGARSLDAAGALGLALHFLSSTMREISLQQIFALIPTTVSRYTDFALSLLHHILRKMPEAEIRWPTTDQMAEYAEIIHQRHPGLASNDYGVFHGAFGSIDGLNCPMATSDNPELENASYNGWLHSHVCSNVLVFSPRGEVLAARVNAPGSWHDSRIAQPIYEKLREETQDGYYLVADTAFPRGGNQIASKIKAPIKSGQVLPQGPEERQDTLQFNRQLLSYRQTAEWGMRALQGSFGRLRLPLPANDATSRERTLEVCVRLHQLRTRCVGINQIRNVYEPIWKAADGEELWEGFESMVFGEVRRRDRVSAFHIVAVPEGGEDQV